MDYAKLYSGKHLKEIEEKWNFKKWSYRNTFAAKMGYIEKLLNKTSKGYKILDAGCGQGLLVEEFHRRGYDIKGMDAFYESELVKKDNILNNKFADETFDLILCLDVIEHLQLNEQEKLIRELARICKPKGRIIFSIPNLANLSSRIMFMLTGNFIRTANARAFLSQKKLPLEARDIYHPGDRPIKEYYKMISPYFKIEKKKGISATIPVLFQMTQKFPQFTGWLYFLLKPFQVFTGWCFNVVVIGRKKS